MNLKSLFSFKCKNTAPGKDMPCYEMFRNMPIDSQQIILQLFKEAWNAGVIPSVWIHAIIVPILNANKIRLDRFSYQPIALTLCKLMERIITMRLTWVMEKMGC